MHVPVPLWLIPVLKRFAAPIRFLISGGTAALVLLVALYVFTDMVGLWYLLSSVLAFLLAFITSFTLHKFWTFRDLHVGRIPRQATSHFSVGLLNLFLNTGLLYLLVDYGGMHYLFAQVLISASLAAGSFFVYKHFIFEKGSAGARPEFQEPAPIEKS